MCLSFQVYHVQSSVLKWYSPAEKMHFVLEYARTNSKQDCAATHFVRKFSKMSSIAKQIWSWQKNFKTKNVCAEQKDLDDQQQQRRRLSGFAKHSCKTHKVHKKNKPGDPDSSNDSLASYKLQLIQAIMADDKQKQKQLC